MLIAPLSKQTAQGERRQQQIHIVCYLKSLKCHSDIQRRAVDTFKWNCCFLFSTRESIGKYIYLTDDTMVYAKMSKWVFFKAPD